MRAMIAPPPNPHPAAPPNPHPAAPPNPAAPPRNPLAGAIAELEKRQHELLAGYRAGHTPQSLVSRHLQGRVREQESFVAEKYAGLSDAQRKQADPAMQAMEQARQAVLQEEIEQREKLNRKLKGGRQALEGFVRNLGAGNNIGAVGSALSPVAGLGGAAAAGVAVLTTYLARVQQEFDERQERIHRGGRDLSPSGARSEDVARQLAEMAEARREGELIRQNQAAREQYRRQQALQRGLPDSEDPEKAWSNPGSQGSRTGFMAWYDRLAVALTTRNWNEGNIHRSRQLADYYERWLQEHGGIPGPVKRDIPNVAEAGITSARSYQSELQIGTLQREDLSNEKFQEVLRHMRDLGVLLEAVKQNTNVVNQNPQWSP